MPKSSHDWQLVRQALVANMRPINAIDADIINNRVPDLVTNSYVAANYDWALVERYLDTTFQNFITAFASGVPGPDLFYCDVAFNEVRRMLQAERNDAIAEATAVAGADKLKGAGADKLKDKRKDTTPKHQWTQSGSATIGPRAQLEAGPPRTPTEDCSNWKRGAHCNRAYNNGNCTRRHVGAFGKDGKEE
jgi:hypothetical protein